MKTNLLALVGLALCHAQNVAQKTTNFEGQVTSITGELLRNVSVQLVAQSPTGTRPDGSVPIHDAYTVVTDASGRFHFDPLPGGQYILYSRRTGYIADGRNLTIDASQPPAPVSIQLTPLGRIEGTVTDEDGEPYRGTISVGDGAPTDIGADGTFVVSVSPGHYYLQAKRDPHPSGIGGEMTGTWPREMDAPTYYPNSITTSGATRVNVPAGAVVRGIDIRVRRVTVYTLRGRAVDGSTGEPIVNTEIQLVADGQTRRWELPATTTHADGSFEFKDLQPGTYWPTTSMPNIVDGPVPRAMYSLQPVVVGKENIDDLEITLQRGAEVRGKVTMESGEPVKSTAGWRVSLRGANGNRGAQVQNDGSFVISDLEPGKYGLQIFARPSQTYVKSIRLNQQEISDSQVDLSSGIGGVMDVVFSPHPAEVSGSIRDASGAPVPQTTVTVWRPGRTTGGTQVPPEGTTVTDASGGFRVGNLAPGEYRVAAWADSRIGLLLIPEFLSQFDNRAAVVRLQEDQRANVDVPLIPPDAIDQAQEDNER